MPYPSTQSKKPYSKCSKIIFESILNFSWFSLISTHTFLTVLAFEYSDKYLITKLYFFIKRKSQVLIWGSLLEEEFWLLFLFRDKRNENKSKQFVNYSFGTNKQVIKINRVGK